VGSCTSVSNLGEGETFTFDRLRYKKEDASAQPTDEAKQMLDPTLNLG